MTRKASLVGRRPAIHRELAAERHQERRRQADAERAARGAARRPGRRFMVWPLAARRIQPLATGATS